MHLEGLKLDEALFQETNSQAFETSSYRMARYAARTENGSEYFTNEDNNAIDKAIKPPY